MILPKAVLRSGIVTEPTSGFLISECGSILGPAVMGRGSHRLVM
jgi:hypothetical protein